MAPVFGEGGNLPTRFFELDREMLKREGFDFEKFAKKVRRLSIVRTKSTRHVAGDAGHRHVARALRAHADAAGARRARGRGAQGALLCGNQPVRRAYPTILH